jgi:glycerol uptake facilitator protein
MPVGRFHGGTVHWSQIGVYLGAEVAGGLTAGFANVGLDAERAAVRASEPIAAPTEGVPA